MKNMTAVIAAMAILASVAMTAQAGKPIRPRPIEKWVTVTEMAAGTSLKAKDEAVATALKKAVSQVCGQFIRAQTKTKNYQAVYDKVLGNTTGYVVEHKVVKTWNDGELTYAKVKALVSTKKFSEKWSNIAHVVQQENNPRVIVAIPEATSWSLGKADFNYDEEGIIQTALEDFFLKHDLVLVDRKTTEEVSKRDIMLANMQDDTQAIAALGARFKADVIITGKAYAKYGRHITVAHTKMHSYAARMNIRAIQCDSGRVLVSKTYNLTVNTTQRGSGAEKALGKLAKKYSPKVLAAVVRAWQKRANVSRNVTVTISGMDFTAWKLFKKETAKLRAIQNVRLREITQNVANIDVEYDHNNEMLAETLTELKSIKLKVTEITANRVRCRMNGDSDKTTDDEGYTEE